jgi:23S rRNA pseudouridine2605 synthase
MDLVSNASKERIYPVGRLDRNTTGLLLFTNDGELAKKLTHPKHDVRKLYHASLDKKLELKDLEKLRGEVIIEGKKVFIDAVSYVDGQPKSEVGIEIHSGRNRIVRKIFEHLGYKVSKLDRVIFAELTKKNLPRGRWRELTNQEVSNLQMLK